MKELAPTGTLRVGVVFAPSGSPLFVIKDTAGDPHGVTVDLGRALAAELGIPVEFMVAPNTGHLVDALEAGTLDVSFMPIDEQRKARLDFGPAYFLVESTYMVTGASGIGTVDEVDRPGVRVVGIANTSTIRSAERILKHASLAAAASVDEAMALMTGGKADAFALSRDSLPPFVAQLPGSRITDGGIQFTGVAIAVPKGRPAALAAATKFMAQAKASGAVRRAMDRAGLQDLAVAP